MNLEEEVQKGELPEGGLLILLEDYIEPSVETVFKLVPQLDEGRFFLLWVVATIPLTAW